MTKLWFDVDVHDGLGMDADDFRRYAVLAETLEEACRIGLEAATPNLNATAVRMEGFDLELDGMEYDEVIE